ncbi:MAG: S1 family serine peptidase [Paracoccaceae bacterium]
MRLGLVVGLVVVASGAVAEEGLAPAKGAGSPFAFAQSGAKAARAIEQAQSGAKVVGGEEAAEGEWPWQVALLIAGQPVGPEAQFCGGTMILDTWVLTAAHCVHMADDAGVYADLPPEALSVLVGSNLLAPGLGDSVPVAAVYRHPDYVGTAFDHDIALLRLARAPAVPYATVEVPDAEFGDMLDSPGVVTIVTGWGLTEGGAHPETLRETEIQMLDRAECNDAMLEKRAEEAAKGFGYAAQVFGLAEGDAYAVWDDLVAKAPPALSENMLCSGTYEGGKLACSGDSGGPLVVPLNDGSYVQAGGVRWGLSAQNGTGCEETASFSAYTRVSSFLPWLNRVISENP